MFEKYGFQGEGRCVKALISGLLLMVAPMVSGSGSVAGEGQFYDFTIPWNDSGQSGVNVGKLVLDPPAGKHGRLLADGDHLVFQDGTRARFYGVGVAVSPGFPPKDKEEIRIFVSRLARYGINHVRINALDFDRSGVFSRWRSTGKLDHPLVDRIDYLIQVLRENGIYYSFSLNNNTAKYGDARDVAVNKRTPKHNNRKIIQLYDKQALAVAVEWVRAYMGHKNPYSGITIAMDPANIYFAAVNEDSVFSSFFRGFRKLGSAGFEQLQVKFNTYLAGRYDSEASLKQAWNGAGGSGLRRDESLGRKSIRLLGVDELMNSTPARKKDTVVFLIDTDIAYGESIKAVLDDVGYQGLYTITNDWFGYTSLYANWRVGSYVDMHSYFDLPKRKGPGREVIKNKSYIQSPAVDWNAFARPARKHENQIFKLFASALTDRPLIISEWNHSGWSDYAYEGALLITAYSAFQGYPLLDLHTMFSTGGGVRDEVSEKALAVVGNQVINALLPSLSLAFINGMIDEGRDPVIVSMGPDSDAFVDFVLRTRLDTSMGPGNMPPGIAFLRRFRHEFSPSGKVSKKLSVPALPRGTWETDTGQVKWDFRKAEKSVLTVDSPGFQAAAGQLASGEVRVGRTVIALDRNGVATLVALDNQPLVRSRNILLTNVSAFRNAGAIYHDSKAGSAREVADPGHAPVRLMRVKGEVRFASERRGVPRVYALGANGEKIQVDGVKARPEGEFMVVSIPIGDVDSPWYVIEYPV